MLIILIPYSNSTVRGHNFSHNTTTLTLCLMSYYGVLLLHALSFFHEVTADGKHFRLCSLGNHNTHCVLSAWSTVSKARVEGGSF